MNSAISFGRLMLGVSAALVLASACTTRVVSGIGTGGSASTSTSTSSGKTTTTTVSSTSTTSGGGNHPGTGGAGGSEPGFKDLAIRYGDLPPVNVMTGTSTSSTSTSSGGPGPDPDSIELDISDAPIACGPDYWNQPCNSWRVNILVPPKLVVVGQPTPFDQLNTVYSETGTGMPMNCNGSSAASGGPGPGTFEITAMDATTISYRLTGVDIPVGSDINGDHVATRCKP